jgi:hypothetical protein
MTLLFAKQLDRRFEMPDLELFVIVNKNLVIVGKKLEWDKTESPLKILYSSESILPNFFSSLMKNFSAFC